MITSSSGVFTPEGYAEAMQRFGAELGPSVVRALRRSGKVVRAIAISKFRSRGVGRGIFGKNPKGAFGLIKVGAVRASGRTFILALEMRGFAALQEQGGRTKPHDIKPKLKKALRLKVPSIGDVVRGQVRHPGSNIPRHPFASQALHTAAPRIQKAIDEEITKAIQKLRVA